MLSIGLVAVVAMAGCGADDPLRSGGPTVPTGGPTTTVDGPSTSLGSDPAEPGRGWLGGEPDWAGGGDTAGSAGALAYEAADDAGAARDVVAASPPVDIGDTDDTSTESGTSLRAGSVDDNADYAAYLAYLQRIRDLGIPLRDFDPSGRVVVSVTGSDGRPVAGATVLVTTGNDTAAPVATIVTTADGTARFLPGAYGRPVDGSFTFTVEGASVDAAGGGSADLVVDRAGGADGTVALDVLFLLDATGSMSDEIDRLKSSIDSVAARVDALAAAPDVRFGMTLYRDEGDQFVTASYDFTDDVEAFRAALADVVADGGGDYPEALDEGLAEALAEPAWRDPASTIQLVFLVADAPPQVARQVATPYPASIAEAIGRGIKIFPVASSESDDQAEAVFRQLAQATGARFVFLTYGAGGAATGTNTDIDRTDYEELALDDLVVRLIAEEVAALTGDETVVPPPTPTTTTVPDGQ
jgi:hypothetical protein